VNTSETPQKREPRRIILDIHLTQTSSSGISYFLLGLLVGVFGLFLLGGGFNLLRMLSQ